MTAEHFVLGMGLHNMTRSKKLIQLVNKLGHCIDYNDVCDILTAQAQKSSELAKSSSILPTYVDISQVASKSVFWLLLRKANGILQFRGPNDQVLPTFAGWLLKHRQNDVVTKTVEMYLPPISSKVTDSSTIFKYLSRLQKLSADVNMPYMNVILDIGAAMNAYKMIWNYPHKFANCVVHPGDFHAMKENYCVIGNIVAASGFKNVVFQSAINRDIISYTNAYTHRQTMIL